MADGKNIEVGLNTDYEELDKITTGLYDGNFIVIGGRPASGKSTFGLSLMVNICTHSEVNAGFFSLEMSKKEITDKIMSNRSGAR